jgi:hypothetical protein
MYFHSIDPLHCTLFREDARYAGSRAYGHLHIDQPRLSIYHVQAYLEVTGETGVVVDDIHIPPRNTIALNNASRFMIWKKLFEFAYPPRETRAILLAARVSPPPFALPSL